MSRGLTGLVLALVCGCGTDRTAPAPPDWHVQVEQPAFIRSVGLPDYRLANIRALLADGSGGFFAVSGVGSTVHLDAAGHLLERGERVDGANTRSGMGAALAADGSLWLLGAESGTLVRRPPGGGAPELFGSYGTQPGQFLEADAIAAGPDGEIHVLDRRNPRVTVLGPDGSYRRHWRVDCPGACSVTLPVSLVVLPAGDCWILDAETASPQHFDADGRWLGGLDPVPGDAYEMSTEELGQDDAGHLAVLQWVARGMRLVVYAPSGPRVVPLPTGYRFYRGPFAPAAGGGYFLAPDGGFPVLHLDADGQVVAALTDGPTNAPGTLRAPTSVELDGAGRLFVFDTADDRVQRFAATGEPQAAWDAPEGVRIAAFAVTRDGWLFRISADGRTLLRTSPDGGTTESLDTGIASLGYGEVTGLAADDRARLYAAISGRPARILQLGPDGHPLREWNAVPEAPGGTVFIRDVAVDPIGRIWALFDYSRLVRVFNAAGGYERDMPLPETRPGLFFSPERITIAPDGNVTLLGTQEDVYPAFDSRVYVFTPAGEMVTRWNFGVTETDAVCGPTDVAWDAAGDLLLLDGAPGCASVKLYGW